MLLTVSGIFPSRLIEIINILTGNLDAKGGTGFPKAAHVPNGSITKKGFAPGRWRSRVSEAPEICGELPAAILCQSHYDFFFHSLSVRNFIAYCPPVIEKGPEEKDKWEILAHLALIGQGRGASVNPGNVANAMVNQLAAGVISAMGSEQNADADGCCKSGYQHQAHCAGGSGSLVCHGRVKRDCCNHGPKAERIISKSEIPGRF